MKKKQTKLLYPKYFGISLPVDLRAVNVALHLIRPKDPIAVHVNAQYFPFVHLLVDADVATGSVQHAAYDRNWRRFHVDETQMAIKMDKNIKKTRSRWTSAF